MRILSYVLPLFLSHVGAVEFENASALNQISEERLRAHVAAVLRVLDDTAAAAAVPQIASFMTAGVLLRTLARDCCASAAEW